MLWRVWCPKRHTMLGGVTVEAGCASGAAGKGAARLYCEGTVHVRLLVNHAVPTRAFEVRESWDMDGYDVEPTGLVA